MNQSIHTYDKTKIGVYWSLMSILYLCYFLVFFGLYYIDPTYIHIITVAIHLFICIFLIWRFHPFREHRLHPFDGQLIFACAFILLTNGFTNEFNEYIKTPVLQFFQKNTITLP